MSTIDARRQTDLVLTKDFTFSTRDSVLRGGSSSICSSPLDTQFGMCISELMNKDNLALEASISTLASEIVFKSVNADDPLISSGLLDSIGLVDLVVAIEEAFSINIDIGQVNESNFNTARMISNFVSAQISK